jgi:phosphoribosylglycinamide formyltransferase-1
MPDTEEVISHSFPHFKVAGRGFATYTVNHHGDEKVALLLNMVKDRQQMLVESAPNCFFVPPYSGPQGWVGVELNRGLSWDRVSKLAWEAYIRLAPASLASTVQHVKVDPPTEQMKPEEICPLKSKKNAAILNRLRTFCLGLPEVVEDAHFGSPSFKAGKKSFCNLGHRDGKTRLQIWVGVDRQVSLTSFNECYEIPAYVGHHGWINLDVTNKQNWQEIEELVLMSYRHFALKRMLKALGH